MAFIDYEALIRTYPTGKMSENIKRLEEYDIFHCLIAGNAERANAVKKRVIDLPCDFIRWIEVCDGGLLFDTSMLTTKSLDAELDLDFDTYGDYFDAEVRQGLELTDGWFVFAVAIHSDVFFFDMNKKDEKVYQWDSDEHTIYAEWMTFNDWLTYQINEAIDLIADEQIMPLGVKMEVSYNG